MATEDKILERVRALLAIAEHPNTTEHEADTALNQANRLMAKHAIDEAMARQAQTISERRAVERRVVQLNNGEYFEFLVNMEAIMIAVAAANRVKALRVYGGGHNMELFGMHEDVQWVESLYTRIYFQFVAKINPRWDEAKSWEENVYNFKVGGFKWFDINEESMKHGHDDMRVYRGEEYNIQTQQVEPKMTGQVKAKMVNAYKRHAKSIGDDNAITTAKHSQYRRDFAEGFEDDIQARMAELKQAQAQDADSIPGAALALRDMAQDVKEAVWAAHPRLHPDNVSKAVQEARVAEDQRRRERNEKLDAMTEKQRYEFLEKERREEERELRRMQAWLKSQPKTDHSAVRAGRKAASEVVLDRNAGATTSRSSQGQIR